MVNSVLYSITLLDSNHDGTKMAALKVSDPLLLEHNLPVSTSTTRSTTTTIRPKMYRAGGSTATHNLRLV